MFVLLKGATKEQSFKIGQEIAEAVTATNPKPVKLKFEKVREQSVNSHTGLAWFSVFLTPSPSSPGSRNVWNIKVCRCMCSLSLAELYVYTCVFGLFGLVCGLCV